MTTQAWLGYIYVKGHYDYPERLEAVDNVVAFLKNHMYDEEIRITDTGDNLFFHARDGVDLYSALHEIGISLPQIYQEIRQDTVAEAGEEGREHEEWEGLYDSIGLSPEEIGMRQSAKAAAKAARTVADVASLLRGTYFDAFFETADGRRRWGYFDAKDYSVREESTDKRVVLDREARVEHTGSGEDVHGFVILDPPLISTP